MNSSTPNPSPPYKADYFDSPNCENLVFDGPGDTTVRPCSPETVRRLTAERERLAKFGLNFDGTPIKPPDAIGPK